MKFPHFVGETILERPKNEEILLRLKFTSFTLIADFKSPEQPTLRLRAGRLWSLLIFDDIGVCKGSSNSIDFNRPQIISFPEVEGYEYQLIYQPVKWVPRCLIRLWELK